jgi:hypothetical protein
VYLGGALLLAAVLGPGLLGSADSFPLSTYPMFSRQRPARSWVATVRGFTANGRSDRIPAEVISSSEPMQAVATLNRALRSGRKATAQLCRDIAVRVPKDYVRLEIRREQYSTQGFFRGEDEALRTRVAARCPVP